MSSDKNAHLILAAKLAKKHGLTNFVAVCPFEHDLAWSEDDKSFYLKAQEAEKEALQANPNLTILKPCLTFGPETHLIHYLAQIAIVGRCPYGNLISPSNQVEYSPIHTEDVATVLAEALTTPKPGSYSVTGQDQMNLRAVMNALERKAGKAMGSTQAASIPPLDLIWDFFYGTGSDLNMSRMIEFYEKNPSVEADQHANPWNVHPSIRFEDWVNATTFSEEAYSHPTLTAYRLAHTD